MNGNIQVLWADDEIELLKPQILFLESKGYSITAVTNGFDAIEKIRENSYEAIFLDEQMPGMSGLETLGAIKEIRPHVPIVLITKNAVTNNTYFLPLLYFVPITLIITCLFCLKYESFIYLILNRIKLKNA